MKVLWSMLVALLLPSQVAAGSVFDPLDGVVYPPSASRTAAGKPGTGYWQQHVGYDITATLDEGARSIKGSAVITYENKSPETLDALWFAIGETGYDPHSLAAQTTVPLDDKGAPQLSAMDLAQAASRRNQPAGAVVESVQDNRGKPLPFRVHDTLVRVELPQPLAPKQKVTVRISWSMTLGDFANLGGRSGYEYFPDTGNYQFSVGQWYPRAVAFTDYGGWAIRPFLGSGEFAAEFGDFRVALTVPAGHVVTATGVLQNSKAILSAVQQGRLKAAEDSDRPVFIITPDEAAANEKTPASGTKTWLFAARNVRDFAWASSAKFIWDAARLRQDDRDNPQVMVMSFYPNEAMPLWAKYSTEVARFALEQYGRRAVRYPYPVMQSVSSYARATGMEYPMITFNGPRPIIDPATGLRQYGRVARDALVELIIHEVGHNFFPMVVGSDERQFAFIDEGINTLLNHLAVLEWEDGQVGALFGPNMEKLYLRALTMEPRTPIVTLADVQKAYLPTTYMKTAGALIVLREQVLGRAVFDQALKTYADRWRFRRATPGDLFRTFEDVSGVKLDWFWRGWFFGTDHFDMAVAGVTEFTAAAMDPAAAPALAADPAPKPLAAEDEPITLRRNRAAGVSFHVSDRPDLQDYHSNREPDAAAPRAPRPLSPVPWLLTATAEGRQSAPFMYAVTIDNKGGLLAPLTLRLTYADGSSEDRRLPVELWRYDQRRIAVPIYADRPITAVALDPDRALPDSDRSNDAFTGPMAKGEVNMQHFPMRDWRGEMELDGVGYTRDGELTPLPPY